MERDDVYKKLDTYLNKNQLKNTKQRQNIIDTFLNMKTKHVTIEELLNEVRKKHKKVGYATVYRTLKLLVEAGIAEQRQFQDGQSQFELESDHHHDHLICTHCDKIIEFENPVIESLQHDVAHGFAFELTGHKMELYGVCQGLKKNGVCSFDPKIKTHTS